MSEATTFAPGSLVQLKSGGPVMTVEEQYRNDELICVCWFSGTELQRDAFERVALQEQVPQEHFMDMIARVARENPRREPAPEPAHVELAYTGER